MADANFTASSSLMDICEHLARTETVVSFIQSITLLGAPGEELTLERSQVTGLYYLLDMVRENITEAVQQIQANKASLKELSHD